MIIVPILAVRKHPIHTRKSPVRDLVFVCAARPSSQHRSQRPSLKTVPFLPWSMPGCPACPPPMWTTSSGNRRKGNSFISYVLEFVFSHAILPVAVLSWCFGILVVWYSGSMVLWLSGNTTTPKDQNTKDHNTIAPQNHSTTIPKDHKTKIHDTYPSCVFHTYRISYSPCGKNPNRHPFCQWPLRHV